MLEIRCTVKLHPFSTDHNHDPVKRGFDCTLRQLKIWLQVLPAGRLAWLFDHRQGTELEPGQNARQDIPIMVFTPRQWRMIQQGTLIVSAAGFPPSELGRNRRFVFALPPRYDYAFPEGYLEVEKIMRGKPLKAF